MVIFIAVSGEGTTYVWMQFEITVYSKGGFYAGNHDDERGCQVPETS
jgi:hypothetical protein